MAMASAELTTSLKGLIYDELPTAMPPKELLSEDEETFNLSALQNMGNVSDSILCSEDIPRALTLLKAQGYPGVIALVVCLCCVVLSLCIYVEEIIFCSKYFSGKTRKRRTIYILGLSPMFSLCAMLGVLMPRAGTLVDFVANTYFAMGLYSLMCLLDDYMGGRSIATSSGVTHVNLKTPPVCCCCLCLPDVKLNRKSYRILLALVYQVTIIRPLLMFLAAVLWLDGGYIPGKIAGSNAYIYIFVPNLICTMVAVWILIAIQKSFRPVLARFRVLPKFLYIQLCLLGTVIGNITIAILVSKGVVPCSEFIPSRARASRLYHLFIIFWMFLVSLWGRFAFRRKEDGIRSVGDPCKDPEGGEDPECLALNGNDEKVQIDAQLNNESKPLHTNMEKAPNM